MAIALLLLGIALGFDSFRVCLGLGALKPPLSRRLQLASAFAVCDGVAPLLGVGLGQGFSSWLQRWSHYAGPLVLAGYGLYLIATSRLGQKSTEESGWRLFGLPLVLSLDNLVAGVGLGLAGFPLLLSAIVIGAMSGWMALGGLWIGARISCSLRVQAQLLSGCLLVIVGILQLWDPL